MGSAARRSDAPTEEYHSYVMRVRAQEGSPRGPSQEPALSVRVEYVNGRQAMHFTTLSGAFDFIAASVRHNILQPDS